MNRNFLGCGVVLVSVLGVAGVAAGQQFQIGLMEVSQDAGGSRGGLSFLGPNLGSGDRRGVVLDGGSDAYDDAGVYFEGFPTGLSLRRRTTTLADLSVFRWIDTFTNRGTSTVTVSLGFSSNLGSDSFTTLVSEDAFHTVSFEDRPDSTDPVIGAMHGNNAFAAGLVTATLDSGAGVLTRRFTLSLAPSQSLSLAFADFLARDLSDRSGDQALVLSRTSAYIGDPTAIFADLSAAEAGRIANWTIPAPSSGVVWVLAMGDDGEAEDVNGTNGGGTIE